MMNTKAIEKDIAEIIELYRACTEKMESQGIDQWGDDYPDKGVITEDVKNGNLHMIKEDGVIKAVITIDQNQYWFYSDADWQVNTDKVLVVHRLAVHPEFQGRGISKDLMDYTEDYAVKNNYDCIRMDVYSGNPIAISLYEKRKYSKTGEKLIGNYRKLPFYLYEKVLINHNQKN